MTAVAPSNTVITQAGSHLLHVSDSDTRPFVASVDDPHYYLHNFETVVTWVLARHQDLLCADEVAVLQQFFSMPLPSRALLVRMVMRKGAVFRASKLRYTEIGDTHAAVAPLMAFGWVRSDTPLTVQELFGLLTRDELRTVFGAQFSRSGRKADWLAEMEVACPEAQSFDHWCPALDDTAYSLRLMPLYDRVRLLFFGNLHQDWSEFVLSDLGIFRYETVAFTTESRAFRIRDDVDWYLQINDCRDRLEQEESVETLVAELSAITCDNRWVMARRDKLLCRIGEHCERAQEWALAEQVYQQSTYPGARVRRIRVLERLQRLDDALALCELAMRTPENAAEAQHLQRIVPRLQRKLGRAIARQRTDRSAVCIDMELPLPTEPIWVEEVVRQLLDQPAAPAHYVENTLINSLFGLLCWEAIFASVPGAFFHPFQQGPSDLLSSDFRATRAAVFEYLLGQLDTGEHVATIKQNFRDKFGLQSPFVYWSAIDEALIDVALQCIPGSHLRCIFERLLDDIKANRSGLPDLIQFWPPERRYQLIEVKGPGDRLQDNQIRWLDFCVEQGIPISVCYVQWQV